MKIKTTFFRLYYTITTCESLKILFDFSFQIFKHYTKKQWDKYPDELDASVLARLPFRLNNESRYFNDPYEALPKHGYTRFFENILLQDENIDVRLNVDYFKVYYLELHSIYLNIKLLFFNHCKFQSWLIFYLQRYKMGFLLINC